MGRLPHTRTVVAQSGQPTPGPSLPGRGEGRRVGKVETSGPSPELSLVVEPSPGASSTLWFVGLPKFDRIAFRILDAREAAETGHIPFGIGDHRDPCRTKRRYQGIDIVDAQN